MAQSCHTPQVAPATYHDLDRSISNMYFFEWSINCTINKRSNIYRTFCVNCFNLLFVAFVIVLFSFSLFANTLYSLSSSLSPSFFSGKFCAQLRAVIARIARQGASPMANSHCCFALLLLLFVFFLYFFVFYLFVFALCESVVSLAYKSIVNPRCALIKMLINF